MPWCAVQCGCSLGNRIALLPSQTEDAWQQASACMRGTGPEKGTCWFPQPAPRTLLAPHPQWHTFGRNPQSRRTTQSCCWRRVASKFRCSLLAHSLYPSDVLSDVRTLHPLRLPCQLPNCSRSTRLALRTSRNAKNTALGGSPAECKWVTCCLHQTSFVCR